jgi:hypothetical protein
MLVSHDEIGSVLRRGTYEGLSKDVWLIVPRTSFLDGRPIARECDMRCVQAPSAA